MKMALKNNLNYVFTLVVLVASFTPGHTDDPPSSSSRSPRSHRAECQMWAKLENKTLPLQDQGHANCTTNEDCTGFSCDGMYQGKELSFGMRVLPCQDPPGVEIYGYAPQFNAKNFSHVFMHKSSYMVPGAVLNLSLIPDAIQTVSNEVNGKLEVFIERNPDGKSLMVGLNLQGCINRTCLFSKPVFNHTEIPVPECPSGAPDKSVKVNEVCSMADLNSCGPNQVCVQNEEDPKIGLCECRHKFVQMDDMTCQPPEDDSSAEPESSAPSATKDDKKEKKKTPREYNPAKDNGTGEAEGEAESEEVEATPVKDAGSSGGGTVAAVVISLCVVVLLVGAAAFVVFRTRLAPRLRAQLTRTPYEDIVIGGGRRSESQQNVIA